MSQEYFIYLFVVFFKPKTAYELRISDWSSDVCSSDLLRPSPDQSTGGNRLPMSAHGAHPKGSGMRLRSLLFVPGDQPERFEKAAASGTDAVILDLEDSVSPANKAKARTAVAAWLKESEGRLARFVRLNPLNSGQIGRAQV